MRRGLAFYSISDQASAVSAKVWHDILYLITPWQYQPRLGKIFYMLSVLSRLGSIRRDDILSRLGSRRYYITPFKFAVSSGELTGFSP